MSFLRTTSLRWAGAVAIAVGLAAPLTAQTTVNAPGDSTSGTYFDYMKTVYARAGYPEMMQLPLTSFDNNFELHGLAAESWAVRGRADLDLHPARRPDLQRWPAADGRGLRLCAAARGDHGL
jgi:hypothetical protein